MQKYEFENEQQKRKQGIVYRIRALVDIPRHGVKAGDLGGFLESENNLSHSGDAWVADEAVVMGRGQVRGDVLVKDQAVIKNSSLSGNSVVEGEALLEDSVVTGNSNVFSHQSVVKNCIFHGQNVQIVQNAHVENVRELGYCTSLIVCGNAVIKNDGKALDLSGKNIFIHDNVRLLNCKRIYGLNINIKGNSRLIGLTLTGDNVLIADWVSLEGNIRIQSNVTLLDCVSLHHNGVSEQKIQDAYLSGDLMGTPEMVMVKKA